MLHTTPPASGKVSGLPNALLPKILKIYIDFKWFLIARPLENNKDNTASYFLQ